MSRGEVPQCSYCDRDACREVGPRRLVTCATCYRAHNGGGAEERARIIKLLGDISGIDDEMYPTLCETIRESGGEHTSAPEGGERK